MADGYALGGSIQRTDTIAGRAMRTLPIAAGTIAVNTGRPALWGGTNYQVTAGKTLKLVGMWVLSAISQPAFSGTICLVSASNANLDTNVTTLFTFCVGPSGNFPALTVAPIPLFGFTVPATYYVGIYNSTTNITTTLGSVFLMGYEE